MPPPLVLTTAPARHRARAPARPLAFVPRAAGGTPRPVLAQVRAANITWSSDLKQRRGEAKAQAEELQELKKTHAAAVSQATMWEERSNKLQARPAPALAPARARARTRPHARALSRLLSRATLTRPLVHTARPAASPG